MKQRPSGIDEQVARQQQLWAETANLDPIEKEKDLAGACAFHTHQPLCRVLDHLRRQVVRAGR